MKSSTLSSLHDCPAHTILNSDSNASVSQYERFPSPYTVTPVTDITPHSSAHVFAVDTPDTTVL